MIFILSVVPSRFPAATSHFELTAVRSNLWTCLGVVITWGSAEVLVNKAACAITFKKEALVTCWAELSKLIECDAFTTSSKDAGAGGFCELKSANLHLWNFKEAFIIGDLSNKNGDCLSFLAVKSCSKAAKRVWAPVCAGNAKAMSNLSIEVIACAASKECVKIVEHLHLGISCLWLLPLFTGNSVIKINTHCKRETKPLFQYNYWSARILLKNGIIAYLIVCSSYTFSVNYDSCVILLGL